MTEVSPASIQSSSSRSSISSPSSETSIKAKHDITSQEHSDANRNLSLARKFTFRWLKVCLRRTVKAKVALKAELKNCKFFLHQQHIQASEREKADSWLQGEATRFLHLKYQADFARTVRERSSENEASQQHIKSISEQLDSTKDHLHNLERQHLVLCEHTNSLEAQCRQRYQQACELDVALRHAHAEHQNTSKALAQKQEEAKELTTINSNVVSRVQGLQRTLDEIESENSGLKEVENARREAHLVTEANYRQVIQHLGKQCNEYHESWEWYQARVVELSWALENFRETVPDRDRHIRDLKGNCEAARRQTVELLVKNRELAQSKDRDIDQLRLAKETLEHKLADQAIQLDTLTSHQSLMVELNKRLERFQGRGRWAGFGEEMISLFNKLKVDTAQLAEGISTIHQHADRYRDETAEAKVQLSETKANLDAMREARDEACQELQGQNHELFRLRIEVGEVLPKTFNDEMKAKNDEIGRLELRIKNYEAEAACLTVDTAPELRRTLCRRYTKTIHRIERRLYKQIKKLQEEKDVLEAKNNQDSRDLCEARADLLDVALEKEETRVKYETEINVLKRICDPEIDCNTWKLAESLIAEEKRRKAVEKAFADYKRLHEVAHDLREIDNFGWEHTSNNKSDGEKRSDDDENVDIHEVDGTNDDIVESDTESIIASCSEVSSMTNDEDDTERLLEIAGQVPLDAIYDFDELNAAQEVHPLPDLGNIDRGSVIAALQAVGSEGGLPQQDVDNTKIDEAAYIADLNALRGQLAGLETSNSADVGEQRSGPQRMALQQAVQKPSSPEMPQSGTVHSPHGHHQRRQRRQCQPQQAPRSALQDLLDDSVPDVNNHQPGYIQGAKSMHNHVRNSFTPWDDGFAQAQELRQPIPPHPQAPRSRFAQFWSGPEVAQPNTVLENPTDQP